MKHKAQIIIVAIVFFIMGFLTPSVFLKNYYEQRRNDNEAYNLNVELNANISNLKDFDEGREDTLRETLERDLNYSTLHAKMLLEKSKLSEAPKQVLAEKVAKAELALKDRTKTLDELLFSQHNP